VRRSRGVNERFVRSDYLRREKKCMQVGWISPRPILKCQANGGADCVKLNSTHRYHNPMAR
jgi:hypothetical protein